MNNPIVEAAIDCIRKAETELQRAADILKAGDCVTLEHEARYTARLVNNLNDYIHFVAR